MSTSPRRVSPKALQAALPFCSGGATLIALGALTWLTDSWFLRILGIVAVLVGGYVALIGIGLLRLRAAARRTAAEQALDAAVLQTAADSGTGTCASGGTCSTCDTTCALRH